MGLIVSDEGCIYVVGATEAPGPAGDSIRTPAIWAEADTGWVLTPGPEDAGILLTAEWHDGVGIEAAGISATTLLTLRGTPEEGLDWSSITTPYPGFEAFISDMALDGGTVYVGGTLWASESPLLVRGLFMQGSGSTLAPMESPCGECADVVITAVESRDGGAYWGGLIREDVPLGTPAELMGWLAIYDEGSRVWANVELPPEIQRVNDILNLDGTLFLAVENANGPGIYRFQGHSFAAESTPESGFIYSLAQTPDGRLIGGGTWTAPPERGDPLLVERDQ